MPEAFFEAELKYLHEVQLVMESADSQGSKSKRKN